MNDVSVSLYEIVSVIASGLEGVGGRGVRSTVGISGICKQIDPETCLRTPTLP